ncbi:ATP-binding protein [Streptomyces sp. NPDC058818]|uniref:ATP-binding protein n=1 Tax=Streptomyces sp. NPDC058818 TaxID=3346640 RepID=UPI0036924093
MGTHADRGDCGRPDGHVAQAGFVLGGGDGCIAEARRLAAVFLEQARSDHDLPVSAHVTDLTQLVVSELVTNARKYAPGLVVMELCVTTDAVHIGVLDSDPTIPEARPADAGRIGQHGLEIVRAVALDLRFRNEAVGKRITARIGL